MSEYNPELIRAWNDYIGPWHESCAPDQVMPAWNAFKAGWDARLKHDLAMEKPKVRLGQAHRGFGNAI